MQCSAVCATDSVTGAQTMALPFYQFLPSTSSSYVSWSTLIPGGQWSVTVVIISWSGMWMRKQIIWQISKRSKAIKSFGLFVKINFREPELEKVWCMHRWLLKVIFCLPFFLHISPITHVSACKFDCKCWIPAITVLFCKLEFFFTLTMSGKFGTY